MKFTITVNIPRVDLHVHQSSDPAILTRLDGLATQVADLGVSIMGKLEEQHMLLDQINAYTNTIAEGETASAVQLTEIGADIDDLLATVSDTTVKAKLELTSAALATAAAAATARAQTLTNIAAKHDVPLPPPVPPEPPPA